MSALSTVYDDRPLERGLLLDLPLTDDLKARKGGPSVAATFARADAEDYVDAFGDTQSAGIDVPAFGYAEGIKGFQSLLNSGNPDKLSYPQDGNIDYTGGVVSFRTLPVWDWNALGVGSAFVFFDTGGSAANRNRITLTGIATNVLRFTVWSETAASYRLIDVPVGSLLAGWHMIAFAWTRSGPAGAWIDGVRSGTPASSGAWADLTTLGTTLYIGQQYTLANQADAKLSNLRIYGPSRVRDADALVARITERFIWTPPAPDFAYWVTNDGTYVTDVAGNRVKTK